VLYTESHDEVANGSTRVPTEIDADSPDAAHAFRRSLLGAALMIAAPGVPMLFQGQEWGDEDWFDDTRPLDWDRRDERHGAFSAWRDLIRLRCADLRTGGLRGDQVEVSEPAPGVLAIARWGIGGPASRTVVIVNLFAVDHGHVDLELDPDVGWEVVFASDWTGYHGAGTDHVEGIVDAGCAVPAYGCVVVAASG
jgi:1,4-alpha-glucan branching enzyme